MPVLSRHADVTELERQLGVEIPLDHLHGLIRRAAQSIRPVVEHGMCLVTCSDEFNGETRASFDRDVARPIMAPLTVGARRIFAVANMSGRVEPGALTLASQHFTVQSARHGDKLLVVEIAAHVGRLASDKELIFGTVDRFGVPSPCCGALTLLLEPPESAAGVRHPWFDQLKAFFGPERLAILRADDSPLRMVRTALVHAVLQAETALTDLLRDPPATPTHVLLVAVVVINQNGPETAVLAACHHVHVRDGVVHFESGESLRTTPDELHIELTSGRLRVKTDRAHEAPAERIQPPPRTHAAVVSASLATKASERARAPDVQARLAKVRAEFERLEHRGLADSAYARPLLRGLVQNLATVAPEVALATMAAHGATAAQRVSELSSHGASEEKLRRVLHDLEPEIQQLSHGAARAMLAEFLALEHRAGK